MKKCEEVSKQLIAYLDRRANSAERHEVEEHLAACSACHERAEDFRKLWGVLDEVPLVEPSLGFDARIRARIAEEPRRGWLGWLVPQPRLAFAMALLLALSVWMAKLPREANVAGNEQDFEAIKDLGVLENYDVLSKFDALSEVPVEAVPADQQAQPVNQGGDQQPATEE
ncbi:MAG: zf-HC2 domain-containing protein [Candidatus Acidiferrales bacterium]|jgi:anti-sigma factor RsiW